VPDREPGSTWENGYIEPYNGTLRDELLNRGLFDTLLEVKNLDRNSVSSIVVLIKIFSGWTVYWLIRNSPQRGVKLYINLHYVYLLK
jgi:hypothetical protein